MSKKLIILLISLISLRSSVSAETTYDYSASDIFDPVIDNVGETFHIDFYTVISILVIIVIILAVIFSSTLIKKILYNPFKEKNVFSMNVSNRKIKNIDPNLDVNEFKQNAFEKFKLIEEAFSNFNYEYLKESLSNNLYNDKISELESFKKRKLQNVISDIKQEYIQINNIQKENDKKTVDVILTVQCKDYMVNYENLDSVMSGSKRDTQERTYLLTFMEKEEKKICDKCGGDVENEICLYCRAKYEKESFNWILSKMKVLKQRTIGK